MAVRYSLNMLGKQKLGCIHATMHDVVFHTHQLKVI